jgi:thymidylate kinase
MVMMPSATEWRDQRRAEPNGTVEEAERESPSGGATRLPTRLERLFGALERSGERWCLLRPAAMLAHTEGDIDLLVDRPSLDHVRELLSSDGFCVVPIRSRDLHAADYDLDSDRFLWVHVQSELRLGTELLSARAVLDTVERDALPQPADEWLFWILLLHDILEKGEIPQRHRSELARLAGSAGTGAAPLSAIAQTRGLDAEALVALVRAGDWAQLHGLASERRASSRSARGRLAAAADRVAGLWTWRGVSVAIMGPDGAGKTTLVNGLRAALPFPTRVLYMGLTGGRLPRADALRVPGLVLAARLTLLWARYGAGLYHRARGRIVLFDRYTLDGKVPSGAQPGALGRLSRRVQALAVPRPELLLLLDASGATMHSRKGEYDPVQLEEWREAYQRLRGRVRGLEVLDAEQPPNAVRHDAQARIWQFYVQRWQSR